jgi:hypothetical protein
VHCAAGPEMRSTWQDCRYCCGDRAPQLWHGRNRAGAAARWVPPQQGPMALGSRKSLEFFAVQAGAWFATTWLRRRYPASMLPESDRRPHRATPGIPENNPKNAPKSGPQHQKQPAAHRSPVTSASKHPADPADALDQVEPALAGDQIPHFHQPHRIVGRHGIEYTVLDGRYCERADDQGP